MRRGLRKSKHPFRNKVGTPNSSIMKLKEFAHRLSKYINPYLSNLIIYTSVRKNPNTHLETKLGPHISVS